MLIIVAFLVCICTSIVAAGEVKEERPRCYGVNEVYSQCGSACPRTCDSITGVDPFKICIEICVPGCVCIRDHVRNRWGNCIPINQCPCPGPNEVFYCGSACQTTCETLGQTCPIVNVKCNDTCYCKDGYARDKNGICIPIYECTGYNKV